MSATSACADCVDARADAELMSSQERERVCVRLPRPDLWPLRMPSVPPRSLPPQPTLNADACLIAAVYLCTDMNPHATRCTLQTGLFNSAPLDPLLADLHLSLLPRLARRVDVLVFNPPYVETWDEEAASAQDVERGLGIEKTWAGGEAGMRVTERLLEVVEVSGARGAGAECGMRDAMRAAAPGWGGVAQGRS